MNISRTGVLIELLIEVMNGFNWRWGYSAYLLLGPGRCRVGPGG